MSEPKFDNGEEVIITNFRTIGGARSVVRGFINVVTYTGVEKQYIVENPDKGQPHKFDMIAVKESALEKLH